MLHNSTDYFLPTNQHTLPFHKVEHVDPRSIARAKAVQDQNVEIRNGNVVEPKLTPGITVNPVLKLDQLFLVWLSLPETQPYITGLLDNIKGGFQNAFTSKQASPTESTGQQLPKPTTQPAQIPSRPKEVIPPFHVPKVDKLRRVRQQKELVCVLVNFYALCFFRSSMFFDVHL